MMSGMSGIKKTLEDGAGFSWLHARMSVMSKQTLNISREDKEILRTIALKVKNLSELPIQEERRNLWIAHHSLKQTKPLIVIDPEIAWYEIIPVDKLKCSGNLAKIWEFMLLKEIIWQEDIQDDRVCQALISVPHVFQQTGFGLETLDDYDDLSKLTYRQIEIDYSKTDKLFELAADTFDGILEVRRESAWWYAFGLTKFAAILRGLENFYFDIYENPEELHALMLFLSNEAMNRLDFLENNNLLALNNGGEFVTSGGYGWCGELPSENYDPKHVKTQDMWGYSESQESISLSPQTYGEFVLPYQLPLLSRFGLNAYGCCEPLDNRIDLITDKVPNLRKVTVSPWSSADFMAEKLGKNYVYCLKMNPAYIATEKIYEESIRAAAREAFNATFKHGCPTEVLMRDVLTLAGDKNNAKIWVEIMQSEASRIFC